MPSYSLENTHLQISVNTFGAELHSVKSSRYNIEYIWQADKTIWARYAPHLFPFVGKLKNNEYIYQNKRYHLPQHGFARDNEFTCIENTANCLVFELKDNEAIFRNYPFHFSYKIRFLLIENTLQVTYLIENRGSDDLFFSVGAHPAFNCPLLPEENFEDYELDFYGKKKLTLNTLTDGLISQATSDLILKDSKLPVDQKLFEQDALVFMNSQIEEVSLLSTKHRHGVKLSSYNWPYFGIWAKPGSCQFVCLEPWYGIADFENTTGDLLKKEGIVKLKQDTSFTCNFSMQFV